MSDPFAAVLPEITAFSEASMPDSFTVDGEGAFVPDGHGGGKHLPALEQGPFKCRLGGGLSEQEQAIADQLQQANVQRMTYPLDTELKGSDSGTATNSRTGETFRYEIVSVIRPGSYAAHRTALIRKVA